MIVQCVGCGRIMVARKPGPAGRACGRSPRGFFWPSVAPPGGGREV